MHLWGVSVWAYLEGIAVTVNCLMAFSSKGRGPTCLSLWIMASFAAGFAIGKFIPYPERMGAFSALDMLLLWRFLMVAKYDGMKWIMWPLATAQLAAIASHMLASAGSSFFLENHAKINDTIFFLTILINGGASVQHDISIRRVIPFLRRHSFSRTAHGTE